MVRLIEVGKHTLTVDGIHKGMVEHISAFWQQRQEDLCEIEACQEHIERTCLKLKPRHKLSDTIT